MPWILLYVADFPGDDYCYSSLEPVSRCAPSIGPL